MLGVLGLSPATKNPSFVGTEELEGPGRCGQESRWQPGASVGSFCFFPALCLKPVERETAGLFIQLWSGGKGEQLRGKTSGSNVSSLNGLDEGQETDRRYGFMHGG